MKTKTASTQLLALCLVALMCMTMITGCAPGSATTAVQKALTVFNVGKSYVAAAQSLVPELQTINPQLAAEVSEYAALAANNLDSLIAIGNAYLSKPNADGYQALLNGVDALAASIDAKVLAAAKISNPASQAKVMAVLSIAATSIHVTVGLLQQYASSKQLNAMPKIAGRVTFDQIRPYLDRPAAEAQIVAWGASHDQANEIMAGAGLPAL